MQAIDKVGWGLLDKVYYIFEEPFWPDKYCFMVRVSPAIGEWVNMQQVQHSSLLPGFAQLLNAFCCLTSIFSPPLKLLGCWLNLQVFGEPVLACLNTGSFARKLGMLPDAEVGPCKLCPYINKLAPKNIRIEMQHSAAAMPCAMAHSFTCPQGYAMRIANACTTQA